MKKARPTVVKPKFDVKYAEHLVHLGSARYVVYGEIGGSIVLRIQECDFKVFNGEKQQTKMVRFTMQQWFDLLGCVDKVDDAINEFDDAKMHIGGNTFIRVQPQRRKVDIREYFLPEDVKCKLDITPKEFEPVLIPTRRGISLSYEEWGKLTNTAIPLIMSGSLALQGAKGDTCMTSHDNQQGWLVCSHCNPNGCMEWR